MYNEEIREERLAASWEPYVEIKFPGLVMGELEGSEILGGGGRLNPDEAEIQRRIERSGYHPALVRALAYPTERKRTGNGYRYTINVPIAAAEHLAEFCGCMVEAVAQDDGAHASVLRALRLTIMHIDAKIAQAKERQGRLDQLHHRGRGHE